MSPRKILVREKFGKGNLPVAICPLDTRPHIYIVYIPKRYKNNPSGFMQEYSDEVWDAIESQFGCRDGNNEEDWDCCEGICPECDFPVLRDYNYTIRLADKEDLENLEVNNDE